MKTNFSLFLVAVLLPFGPSAQNINKYTFSKQSGNTYTDLSGDIAVTTSFNATTGLYTIPGLAGEKFRFFGDTFQIGGATQVSVGEYPFFRIENNTNLGIIDAAFTYADTIDGTSKVSYLVQGGSGSKIIKTQYKNMKLSNGPAGNFINTQIWYYQQSGVIEIHYGPRSANNASGYSTSQGPNVGIFYSPLTFSGCLGKLWCTGSPSATVLDSAKNYVFNAMSGVPDNGTIFRFTPRAASAPTVSTVSVNEAEFQDVLLLGPNPTHNKLLIQGIEGGKAIRVYNATGQLIKTWESLPPGGELEVSDLAAGYYLLYIVNRNNAVLRKKFVISGRN